MPWSASLAPDGAWIDIRYDGRVTPGELEDAFKATIALVRKHDQGCVLADTTQMLGGHTVTDLYYLADALAATGLGGRIREAVLISSLPDSADNVRFWETTCANRGLRVRVFTSRDDAVAWLRAK